MPDERICLNCGRPFLVCRGPENQHAHILYCDDCKKKIENEGRVATHVIDLNHHWILPCTPSN